MKKRYGLGLVLLAGLLLMGCGSQFSANLATGRQISMGPSGHDGIFIHLNETSEVRLHLRGLRMGIAPHIKAPVTDEDQPGPKPWLSYHFHF